MLRKTTLSIHMSFSSLESTFKLKELAKKPFDLTSENALTPQRVKKFCLESAGFRLSYATERVTDEVMDALFALAEERHVIHEMERMQDGEVINCIQGFHSENRAVLHTAVRDFFDAPRSSKASKEAARLAKIECDKLKKFLPQMERFTTLVVIGIGGSELGPKALYLALESYKKYGCEVVFVGNVDPDSVILAFRHLNLEKTAVAVISKSGTTLETSTNEAFARSIFEKQGIDSTRHFIAITGEGSPMDNPKQYLESFYIWDWIGGRYSGTSMIGGVIIGFSCGYEVYIELLKGAHAMDQNALVKDLRRNLPLLGALLSIWNRNFLNTQTLAIIPYSAALSRFSAHLQQLDMESNGKQVDRQGNFIDFQTGPIIWGEAGTNAQHSFFQLIHQGTSLIALELIGFEKSQTGEDFSFKGSTSQQKLIANMIAQSIALATGRENENPNQVFFGNRPSHLLIGEKLKPHALGSLLAYFEHKTAFQGFIWNINSFDQEGVQLGKVLADKVLESNYDLGDAYLEQFKF